LLDISFIETLERNANVKDAQNQCRNIHLIESNETTKNLKDSKHESTVSKSFIEQADGEPLKTNSFWLGLHFLCHAQLLAELSKPQ